MVTLKRGNLFNIAPSTLKALEQHIAHYYLINKTIHSTPSRSLTPPRPRTSHTPAATLLARRRSTDGRGRPSRVT